jgi:hypothetical protein
MALHRCAHVIWTIGRIRRDAVLIGPATAALCDLILEQGPRPNRASDPTSALCGWRARLASPGWKPRVPSRSARLTYG